jgi:hypothetical protein
LRFSRLLLQCFPSSLFFLSLFVVAQVVADRLMVMLLGMYGFCHQLCRVLFGLRLVIAMGAAEVMPLWACSERRCFVSLIVDGSGVGGLWVRVGGLAFSLVGWLVACSCARRESA